MDATDTLNEQLHELLSAFWQQVKPTPIHVDMNYRKKSFDALFNQTEGYTAKVSIESTGYLSETSEKLRALIAKDINVKSIQLFSKVFLEEYNKHIVSKHSSYLRMSEEDIIRLTNTATAIFLENWLVSDTSHRMSVTAFSQQKFGKKEEAEWAFANWKFNPGEESAYRKAYQRYRAIAEENQAQLKREHQPPMEMPTKSEGLRGRPVELDYVTLSALHGWCKDGFKLIKRYWQSRFFVPSETVYDPDADAVAYQHNARHNDNLCKDMLDLYAYIEELRDLYHSANSEETLTEYVAGCMTIYKLERSLHFDLSSRQVINQLRGGIIKDECAQFCWAASIGRIPGFAGFLVGGKNGQIEETSDGPKFHSDYTVIAEILDVLNYQHVIDVCTMFSRSTAYIEGLRVLLQRAALSDLLVMLHGTFPMQNLRPWKLTDFRAAADFFAKEFNFLDKALEARAPDVDSENQYEATVAQSYYDLLIQKMRYLYRDDEQPARQIVDSQKPSKN